jgi:hypothetical protein
LAIASSTRRTDLRRPTSIGMIAPGNSSTELRRSMGSVSGIYGQFPSEALGLVSQIGYLAAQCKIRLADLPVMTGEAGFCD